MAQKRGDAPFLLAGPPFSSRFRWGIGRLGTVRERDEQDNKSNRRCVIKGVAEGIGFRKCSIRRWSDTGFTYLEVCHCEGLLFFLILRDQIKIKGVEALKRKF